MGRVHQCYIRKFTEAIASKPWLDWLKSLIKLLALMKKRDDRHLKGDHPPLNSQIRRAIALTKNQL
jgi:hypothetical protein